MSRRPHLLLIVVVSVVILVVSACSTSGDAKKSSASTPADRGSAPTALIIDGSFSMTQADAPATDGKTVTRMAAAVDAAGTLVDSIPAGTKFSLLTYGTQTGSSPSERTAGCRDVSTLIPLSGVDANAAKSALATIAPRGFTPISTALRAAFDNLPATGRQSIVLVSDGEDTCGVPPCSTARELHDLRPDLTISTVGFRTGGGGNDELSCVAATTGGLFVTAENSAQLAARLRATQDLAQAAEALTSTGIADVSVGQKADDIREQHRDFPAVDDEGEVTVVWKDCDLVFRDGVLTSIEPRDGGRTIDGVAVGSTVESAIGFYGDPVSRKKQSDGTEELIFVADDAAGTAFRVTTDGVGDDAKITKIVLCRCLPEPSDPTALTFGGTEQIQSGTSESDLADVGITPESSKPHGCNSYPVPGAAYLTVYAARGEVLGIKSGLARSGSPAHTTNGIRIGSTASEVRAAFAGSTIVESFQGLDGTYRMLVSNGSDQYIGFGFPGSGSATDSVPDSAQVQSIDAGSKDLAQGFEVCSG